MLLLLLLLLYHPPLPLRPMPPVRILAGVGRSHHIHRRTMEKPYQSAHETPSTSVMTVRNDYIFLLAHLIYCFYEKEKSQQHLLPLMG